MSLVKSTPDRMGPFSWDEAQRVTAALSTAALLRAVRAQYIRVAVDRGLADEWEAAVLLGMAA